MHRDFRLYLDDILSAINRVREYVHGLDRESFISDSKTVDAVIRNLEIIGEASRNLPDDIKAASAEIEWSKRSADKYPSSARFCKVETNTLSNKELAHKLGQLERKIEKHDEEIKAIFNAIRQLMIPPEKPKRKIGFKRENE